MAWASRQAASESSPKTLQACWPPLPRSLRLRLLTSPPRLLLTPQLARLTRTGEQAQPARHGSRQRALTAAGSVHALRLRRLLTSPARPPRASTSASPPHLPASSSSSPPQLANLTHTSEQARPARHGSRRRALAVAGSVHALRFRRLLTSPAHPPHARRRAGTAGEARIEVASSGGSRILPLLSTPFSPPSLSFHASSSRLRARICSSRPSNPPPTPSSLLPRPPMVTAGSGHHELRAPCMWRLGGAGRDVAGKGADAKSMPASGFLFEDMCRLGNARLLSGLSPNGV
ncbi:hypothetical protein PVAP13_9NG401214 [Panicum virgatum]|uniref:Uncharacterized protein n=1 Tax=Panicum virgatum TaxID=38727 RepID=A0A8T0MQU8_PANVG|nr:hypothetical protein PVAP13_9NG401214 [Panicum virgatum]